LTRGKRVLLGVQVLDERKKIRAVPIKGLCERPSPRYFGGRGEENNHKRAVDPTDKIVEGVIQARKPNYIQTTKN